MSLKAGDLVACYITNTSEYEKLFQWGIILEMSEPLGDILVLDNSGHRRWWPRNRWKLLEKTPEKS